MNEEERKYILEGIVEVIQFKLEKLINELLSEAIIREIK